MMRADSRLWFRFSGNPSRQGQFLEGNHVQETNEIIQNSMNDRSPRVFNDLPFYQQLLGMDGCRSVEISAICIDHNSYCHGIQAYYRLIFNDGSTIVMHGPKNNYCREYYAYNGTTRKTKTQVVLDEGEYITGLNIQQGDILDRITVVTNQREVHCGGRGGSPIELMTPNPGSMKVVAFCGTHYNVVQRIGYYAKPFRWEIYGTHLLMRQLIRQNRAVVRASKDLTPTMNGLNRLDDGVFRRILEFLA